MRTIIFVFSIFAVCCVAFAQALPVEDSRYAFGEAKLLELEALPVGIAVSHAPDPVLATWDGRENPPCKWYYATDVRALSESVTITEFGCFSWYQDNWLFCNVTGKPYSQSDFESWYNCPSAKLVEGKAFADKANWSSDCSAVQGKARWYFIGVTESGERVKGEATVELAGKYK